MPRMSARSPRMRALQERERRRLAREGNAFDSIALGFESQMRSLNLSVCQSCRQRKLSTDIIDARCRPCRRTGNTLYTRANMMDFGEIPSALSDMTLVEQILIARVHPVVSVFKIQGMQLGYSGHVMNFIQDVQHVADVLPHDLADLDSVIVLNQETHRGILHFRVRANKVKMALEWLKQFNQYYRDVRISEERIRRLPEDGCVADRLPSIDDVEGENNANVDREVAAEQRANEENLDANRDQNIEISLFPNLAQINEQVEIERNLRNLAADELLEAGEFAPRSDQPLNEFSSEGMICKAFPVLFPYGRGDLREPREHKLTPRNYFKYLFRYYDGRFANDMRFPYYAYNSLARWDAINGGNVYALRHEMRDRDVAALRELAAQPDSNLAASIMYYGCNLRGTRAYWRQRCSELLQMVRQLGTPTVFFTLSAADYHWPDLFRILAGIAGCDPTNLSERDRRDLMHRNPSIVAWFFEQRCAIFMRILEKLFPVKDYWYRYEWQFRGSPHIHGLLWFDDAVDCNDIDSLSEDERQAIVVYFDNLVKATVSRHYPIVTSNPSRKRLTDLTEEEKITDLDLLLHVVQRHTKCGKHCLRRKRNSRRQVCRFGFPIQLEETSTLRIEEGSWRFIPKRNDLLLQRHNPLITQLWRGNSDFSAITSPNAVLNYIAKYASKGEHASESYSTILRTFLRRAASDLPASRIVQQLLISSVAERNYSAQEIMHLVMGSPLYHASRTFIILAVREDWQRIGIMDNNTTVSHYKDRPADLMDLSLLEFAKRHYKRGDRMYTRKQDAIVRVVPYIKLTDDPVANEQYYKLQCKLHIPWRSDFESMRPIHFASWHDLYISRFGDQQPSDEFGDEFPVLPDELVFENEPNTLDHIVRNAGLVASRIRPNDLTEEVVGHRPIDEAFDWPNLSNGPFSEDVIAEYLRTYKRTLVPERARQAAISFDMMSPAQQKVMIIGRQQVQSPGFQIKRVLVQGKAGTGKSAVIKALCEMFDQANPHCAGSTTYQVLAPTGAAAINVDGKTLHSFLRIPVQKPLEKLNGAALRSFQIQFRHMRFIIIDEYSMIGLRMLHKIHDRLVEATGNSNEPFGGLCIYFFGDLRQLPPTGDTSIYEEPRDGYSRFSVGLIQSMQETIVLTVCQRQSADQIEFKQALENLSKGQVSRQDWNLFMARRKAVQSHNRTNFESAVCLFPTNALANDLNMSKLQAMSEPAVTIEALHNNTTALQGTTLQAAALASKLFISRNCRVMLRANICVERGLVNGSLGFVREIIYDSDQRSPSLPHTILIEFDGFAGPYLSYGQHHRLFPLRPIVANWKSNSVDCMRKQFPLCVAYALTIHKSQGLTLDKAIVDIGSSESSVGLSYVALSRVRRLEDLILAKGYDFTRFLSINTNIKVRERERFLSREFPDFIETE